MRARFLGLAAASGLAATGALAHHGWSAYDASRTITFEGPILSARYANPHGELQMNAQGGRWRITLAPPSRLNARGVGAADLAVGKSVRVEGYASRVNEREMRAERLTLDGRTVELR